MGRIVIGIIAVIASFMLAESLDCNKCSVSVFGFCIGQGNVSCSTNTSECFTSRATFPDVSGFLGFNSQGCRESDGCAATVNGTLLTATYEIKSECCTTDLCNPINLSGGASSARLSLTAALGVAVLASVWGNVWF